MAKKNDKMVYVGLGVAAVAAAAAGYYFLVLKKEALVKVSFDETAPQEFFPVNQGGRYLVLVEFDNPAVLSSLEREGFSFASSSKLVGKTLAGPRGETVVGATFEIVAAQTSSLPVPAVAQTGSGAAKVIGIRAPRGA